MHLINPQYGLLDGLETIRGQQEITDEFLAECHENRLASARAPMGDFHQFASVPTAVVDHWMRQGFDVFKESHKAILKRLRDEDLTAFITTEKRL